MHIIFPILVLVIGPGAWRAWHRSPVYSIESNFQLAGVFLLMVSSVVAVTLAIFGRPADYSTFSNAVLIVLSVLMVLAGFIAAALRLPEGRRANLPSGTPVLHVHRRKILPGIRLTGLLLMAFSVAALLIPPRWIAVPLTLGTMVLLLGTAAFYPLYRKARRFDHGMTALIADPWIHWQYTAEQWQAWAAIRRSWERARAPVFLFHRDCPKLLIPMAIFAAASWAMEDGGPGERISAFLGCAAVLLLTAGWLTWSARKEPERRYQQMLAARREAYLGADGILCCGEYFPWVLSGNHLVEAAALRDPPGRLVLSFDAFNGNGTAPVARLIPIPEGCESDLDSLQQHLRSQCPEAEVELGEPASRRA